MRSVSAGLDRHTLRLGITLALAGAVLGSGACTRDAARGRNGARAHGDTAELAALDTGPGVPAPDRGEALRPGPGLESMTAHLSPLADTISGYLVFAPVGESWFLASSRNRRLLLDIGRVDVEVRRDSARAIAFRQAVQRRSPVRVGARFRLRGPWGAEDVTATSVDSWNGRIVLRLAGSAALDTLAAARTALIASAQRTDSVETVRRDSCDRQSPLPDAVVSRVAAIRDSIAEVLRTGQQPPYERLRRKLTFSSSQAVGCFGTGRVVLVVSLRAGNVEWVQERAVLVDTLGRATALRVTDYRFRAHELLGAFDADGDGVDDLATRATTERAGATTILVFDQKLRRLRRFLAGFAWEEQ